ncbi:MAG TPA: hypothetical protein VFM31_11145 [Nitrososphaeraceae archaeon]|jgi:hypothetical protein|nr:hypothetical protein [Nitrososphaeraceae archaeon]
MASRGKAYLIIAGVGAIRDALSGYAYTPIIVMVAMTTIITSI